MAKLIARWRLVALAAALAAATALFLGGGLATPDKASATTPDITGVSCADVYLEELQEPISTTKPITAGTPPKASSGLNLNVATSITYTQHNTTAQTTEGVTVTYNGGIPGVIAGTLPFPSPIRCASVDKSVATVTTNPTTPTDPQTLTITPTPSNGPLVGMIVFWNSTNTAQRGFYRVTASAPTSVTLEKLINGLCNNEPAGVSAPGTLHACKPNNKGIQQQALAFANTNVTKNDVLGDPPRPGSTGTFDKGNNNSFSSTCAVSTGVQEGATQGRWTRTDVRTVVNKSGSEKVPSFGIAQLYNPTAAKTCADVTSPVITKRSTNITVVWSLDSAEREGAIGNWDSDYDKDGCLDHQELASPQPVLLGSAGSFTGGRDPFNPFDCGRNLAGIYNIEVARDEVTLDGGNNIVPGSFFRCKMALDHDKGSNSLAADVFCYTDDPTLTVNPQDAGNQSKCPPAPATACGDGLTGASYPIGSARPPDPLGDVDSPHTSLTGSYNKTTDLITLEGCFAGVENAQLGPNMYWKTTNLDPLTGHGTLEVWLMEPNCNVPGGAADEVDNIQAGITADKNKDDTYDSDLDGCTDRQEFQDAPGSEMTGGLRDPISRWDFYDTNNDGTIDLFLDIFGVAGLFGLPGDDSTNRGPPIAGSVGAWNIRGRDATIDLFNDIFGVAAQFGHAC